MSTRSLHPTHYYQLQFEDNIKSIKSSAPTTNEFTFSHSGALEHHENNSTPNQP